VALSSGGPGSPCKVHENLILQFEVYNNECRYSCCLLNDVQMLALCCTVHWGDIRSGRVAVEGPAVS
jgi:hypothetical protein